MLKIFTTQLLGIIQKINKEEENSIEDVSRMLAQTVLSERHIYFHGKGVLHSVALEAVLGANTLPQSEFLVRDQLVQNVQSQDIVVLITDDQNDLNTLSLIEQLSDTGIQIIGMSPIDKANPTSGLVNHVDLHIELQGTEPIVPLNDDKKIGQPLSLAALYLYFAIYLNTMDILDDFLD